MSKQSLIALCAVAIIGLAAVCSVAQKPRKSVSAAEVTGTFRYTFHAKFKGSSSDIKILALGRGNIKIAFDLVFPHLDGKGNLTANLGQAIGIAEISGNTAVYSSKEFGKCKITVTFVKPGSIKVEQDGMDSDCGFGYNVNADGTYRKVSGRKPRFDPN